MPIPEQVAALQADLAALAQDVSGESIEAIKAKLTGLIAALDQKLSRQINQILHHDEFQQLESAWRGLHYLVSHTKTSEMLKIKVMSISKKELYKTLKRYKGHARKRSPLFVKLHQEPYTSEGGEPFGCLVGDFYFGPDPQDVAMLKEMAEVCAASHFPFIGGGSASIVGFETWQDLAKLHPSKLSQHLRKELTSIPVSQLPRSKRTAWRYLRESENSRYLYLVVPRCLARLPYSAKREPLKVFEFEEQIDDSITNHKQYTWINSAYAMGVIINRAFDRYSWCRRIRGYGDDDDCSVQHLPATTVPFIDFDPFVEHGNLIITNTKCLAEIAIAVDSGVGAFLEQSGLIRLGAYGASHIGFYTFMNSVHKPFESDDPDKTAHNNLSSMLVYLLPTWRFAQSIF